MDRPERRSQHCLDIHRHVGRWLENGGRWKRHIYTSTGPVSPLTPGTTYHYRAVGVNSLGRALGADLTFTTLAQPAVTTSPATSITSTNATLNGTVNPNGAATTAYFRYGLTTSYGSYTVSVR